MVTLSLRYDNNTGNATRLGGDLNGDGLVGFSDLVAIAQNYNAVPMADLDRDGNVKSSDLAIVDANLGHSLPAPAAVALSPDIAAVSGVETPHSVPAALPMAAAAEPLVLHRKPARLEVVQAPSRLRTYSLRRIVSSTDSVFASDQASAKELFGKTQLKSRHPA